MTSTHSQLASDEVESEIDHEKAQRGVRLLLEAVGEDPDRDELAETWQRRVPDAFATLTEGQREAAKPTMRTFDAETTDLVVKTDIPVYSLCEHHLLPFFGTVHLAYRPNEEVVGLSKLTRYVRWQSRQLTMQERLTNDIASGLADELDAATVLVEMNATHLCEAMRGIETESTTTTRATAGEPSEAERERFQAAINRTEGQ
ncbi:GTP cyclohydrolase I FolE [Halobacterium salinarum]|uniref:GTP cyclohydrolase I n=1 Tax=Halobacterium salinarum TaxID=2242 RepID=UPI002553C9BA|nr:GTP cyclohydrolase I FolE [Halobacterium salinarum]MDL0118549.1 GTP cyclohydrolase I FolE [Halobacterium salinarum]MDL0119171.1 GTP cyclohydrolase I FolE [Halobacterium salinarum]MDL0119790.1 GTP cyclohydrolase I FolE [Halobacterium salinarum]